MRIDGVAAVKVNFVVALVVVKGGFVKVTSIVVVVKVVVVVSIVIVTDCFSKVVGCCVGS